MNKTIEQLRSAMPQYADLDNAQFLAAVYKDRGYSKKYPTLMDFARKIEEVGGGPIIESPPIPEPGRMARVGRGIADVYQGVGQLAARAIGNETYEPSVERDMALYERGAGEGFDGYRLLGAGVGAAPAALVGGGYGAAAAIGAGTGAIMYTPADQFYTGKAMQTAGGAVGGVVGQAAGQAIGKGVSAAARGISGMFRNLSGSVRNDIAMQIVEAGERAGIDIMGPSVPAQLRDSLMDEAAAALNATGKLDADAIVRKLNLESFGLQPTRAQVTRNPIDWQFEHNTAAVAGVGDDLRMRLVEQNNRLFGLAEELPQQIAGGPMDDIAAAESVRSVAKQAAKTSQRQVSRAYGEAEATAGIGGVVDDVSGMRSRLTEVYDDFYDVMPAPLRTRVEALVDGNKSPTVEQIVSAARLANKRNPTDKEAMLSVTRTRKVLNDVLDRFAASGDSEAARKVRDASRMAARRFNFLQGDKPKSSVITDLIDDKASTHRFVTGKVMSGDVNDLAHVRRFLTQMPEDFSGLPVEQGKQAWDSVRAGVLRAMIRQASGKSKASDVLPDAQYSQFSGARFEQAMGQLGNARREVLFTPEENKMLDRLMKAAKDITVAPPHMRGSTSDSGTQVPTALVGMLTKISKIPVMGDAFDVFMGLHRSGVQAVDDIARKASVTQALSGSVISPEAVALRKQAADAYVAAVGRAAASGTGTAGAVEARNQYPSNQ